MDKYPLVIRSLIRLSLAFLIIAALIITKTLLVPLCFSVLIAYLLYPAADRLEKKGFSRILTNFLLIVATVVIVVGGVYGIALLIVTFTADLPEIQEQFTQNLSSFQHSLGGLIGIPESEQDSMIKEAVGSTGQYLKTFFTATANSILAIALTPVYTFLLLFYRDKFKKFIQLPGRAVRYLPAPPQTRTSGFPAYGSSACGFVKRACVQFAVLLKDFWTVPTSQILPTSCSVFHHAY